MARACPSCGRPNGDTAETCLYCVAPLLPVAPVDSAAPAPRLPGAPAGPDRHLLIFVPGDTTGDEVVRELARVASVSAYDARLALSARRPRLFRRLESEREARRLSGELTEARVPHYVVREMSVLGLAVARASGAELLADRELKWRLEGVGAGTASALTMPFAGILLLVSGEITRERHHEKRMASVRGTTRRLTSGMRIHLYERDARLAVEIDPESFDFAMLGPEQTPSAHLNLQRLVSRLRALAPAMEVDRGFDLEPVVVTRTGAGDVTDALAQGDRGPDGVIYDNADAFRFYARWRYRLARHLSRAATKESG